MTIERIVAGGYGLAREAGRVLLVPLTAPGDQVEVELPERGSKAGLIRVVRPGRDRVQPVCRYYGECGGCDLMHMSYSAQCDAKADMTLETIRRIGGHDLLSSVTCTPLEPNPLPLRSRIRATWQPTATGRAGYYRRGSHDVVEIGECPILDPALETRRAALRITASAQGLSNGLDVSVATSEREADEIEFSVLGERLRASAAVFFQASSALLDSFVGHVVHLAARGRPDRLLELYSGIGLFTVPLARRVGWIDAVEGSLPAVEHARRNVQSACLRNVACHAATAERWLERRARDGYRVATVLVDPPRSGLSGDVTAGIVALEPGRIVYVSCDPATFARDARKIVDAGYHLTNLKLFDLFPQTHHVELVSAFTRTSPP